MWDSSSQWVEYFFNVESEGLYEIELDYYLPGRGDQAIASIQVNGTIPYLEANRIVFASGYRDRTNEPVYNHAGDEITPSQVPIIRWRSMRLFDSLGFYDEPLLFLFKEGKNVVRFIRIEGTARIGEISLVRPKEILPYKELKKIFEAEGYKPGVSVIEFQAERPVLEKSSSTIRGVVNSDLSVEPQSVQYARINAIGDWRWRKGNQSITWEFQVSEDGLYNIGARNLQWWHDGLPIYRQIQINGQVPFKEMYSYRFEFKRRWTTDLLSDPEGNPYDFYLTKGTHKLTMIVKLGEIAPFIQSLYYDNLAISQLMLNILMITGSDPDVNYDYQLTQKIPNLVSILTELRDSLESKGQYAADLAAKNPAITNQLRQVTRMLTLMIRDPESIPRRFNDFRNAQSSLSSWYLSLQDQPLLIDRFEIVPSGDDVRIVQISIFERISAFVLNLYSSFIKDYDNVGTVTDDEIVDKQILVWVGRGKEWAEIIRQLASDDFTPKNGIGINMNVLPATQLDAGAVNALLMSVAAGKGPDVALAVSSITPVEFAIRNAVVDLTTFHDFEEVSKNFLPGILIPFKYESGVYGLPETMNFRVMIYRTDVIQRLGITLPDTWDDVYQNLLPALYQNNLEFFYPLDFSLFLFQHGGSFYRDAGLRSGLDSTEAYQAFKEYTELFTHYGIPVIANFYNRMRTGEMPIGIGGYAEYIMLSTAAPELAGRWTIAPVPGRQKPDGVIDRSIGGIVGEADIILTSTTDAQASWEFIKWWLSSDVQSEFGREIEAIIGTEARWNTANLEAFSRINWNSEHLGIISQQWDWAQDIPNVVGGYFTSRHINNAWNRVVLGNQEVRSSLEEAIEDINKELRMKQEEYNKTPQIDD